MKVNTTECWSWRRMISNSCLYDKYEAGARAWLAKLSIKTVKASSCLKSQNRPISTIKMLV